MHKIYIPTSQFIQMDSLQIKYMHFNNKKAHNQPSFVQCSPSGYLNRSSYLDSTQITPTQCLLRFSELEASNSHGKGNHDAKQFWEAEVTPWVMSSQQNRVKQQAKSKNTAIMTRQGDHRILINSRPLRKEKQNRLFLTKKDSNRQIKIANRRLQSTKNVRSAIARYNDQSGTIDVISHQFSQKKIQPNPNMHFLRTSHQGSKISSSCHKPKTHKPALNNQNQFSQVGIFGNLRKEQNASGTKRNLSLRHKNSTTESILRQNTGIVNKAMEYIENFEQFKPQNNSNYVQEQEKESQQKVQAPQKQKKDEKFFRKAEFQNILSDAQKKASQYHRIKHKILDSIKKQSIIRQSQQFDINRSKKMLGRYFKQIQQKKPRNKTKTTPFNYSHLHTSCSQPSNSNATVKTQIFDLGFEYSNPLTKHLYDKYKLLLSKGK